MALESAPQNPLGRIDPRSLIGLADPVVTPSSVEALSDAFRKGFVTADDITKRLEQNPAQREKIKLDTMLAKEAQSPEAQLARKSKLTNAPLEQKAQESELKAAILDAQLKGAGILEMQNALTKAGWAVPIDPNKGVTESDQKEIARRFGVLLNFTTEKAKAEMLDKDTEVKNPDIEIIDPQGATIKGPSNIPRITHKGQVVPVEKFKQLQQYKSLLQGMTPAGFDALGQPKAPDLFGVAGQVQPAQPAQPTAIPPNNATPSAIPVDVPALILPKQQAAQARAQLFNEGNTSAASMSDEQVSQLVQSKQAAKPVLSVPSAPQAGQPFESIGMVTGIKAAPDKPEKPYTEVQGRALIALNRAAASNKTLQNLEADPSFDPASVLSQARMAAQRQGLAGQLFSSAAGMTDAERNYIASTDSWLQGLLRLESGAAIAAKEQAWYERTLFPTLGDSKAVQANKTIMRQSIEQAMEQVISGKMTPAQYESLREAVAGNTAPVAPVAPAATTGVQGQAGPVITLSNGRKVQRNANGQYQVVP